MLASGDLPVDRHLLDLEQDKARLQEMALTSLDFNLQAERNLLIKASEVVLSDLLMPPLLYFYLCKL